MRIIKLAIVVLLLGWLAAPAGAQGVLTGTYSATGTAHCNWLMIGVKTG